MNIQKMTRDQKNKSIAVAYKMVADDGRILHVTRWEPCLRAEGKATVKVEGFIELPKSDE